MGLVAIALVAGAWLVVGVRAVDLESEARTLSSERRDVGRALGAVRSARLLSVNKDPSVREGLLLFSAGRRAEGIAIGERVVEEEPENFDAWISLYYMYSTARDEERAVGVARKIRDLNPLAGDRLKELRP